jgi:A/G-specific adenine glycosylase
MSDEALTRHLLQWYVRAARDLPWRRTREPYAIWISETMLQQTRTQTVLPYYDRFMRELPTVFALAEASEDRVLALWSGLGYYRRARMLQAAAKRVVTEYGGRLPQETPQLRQLEGVGRYTAGAIASIAFGQRAALVDGNVARVLSRLYAIADDIQSSRGSVRLWELARRLVAAVDGDPGDWNQALMELGATVCTPTNPGCRECPVSAHCRALAASAVAKFPRRATKAAPASVRRVAVVLASSRGVLLARRRKDVLFGGLWEPPSGDGTFSGLAARLGIDAGRLRPSGEVVHVLTHRRMHIQVARGPLPRRRRWALPGADYDAIEPVALEELRALGTGRAYSSLTRKVLNVANVAAGGLPSKE